MAAHLTYAELDRRANQLAQHLRALGVGPDVRVGVCVERSAELLVALLGVLKAGGAFVPLDPALPAERIALILDDAQAPVILTQERLADRLPTAWALTLCLDSEWPLIARSPAAPAPPRAAPGQLAYVLYTSGSTGSPKGVMIAHRGLANYLRWCRAAYAAAPDGALLHSPIGFDLTITSLFAPLLSGQRVVLAREAAGGAALDAAMRAGPAFSLLKLTPAHLDLLRARPLDQEIAGRVRTLIVGGEALWNDQLAFWRAAAPATRIVNEYGPTETVVGCCVYEVPRAGPAAATPIGRPISNTRIYLLDRRMDPVPVGVPGEIYIGGSQLARGYLGRPDLTAAAFVPNPFTQGSGVSGQGSDPEPRPPIPDPRIYRTGDLARYLPDGSIEFVGRIDAQIKLRGYRIEPGEVAAALLAHPSVRAAAALLRQDASGDPRLVAYVVPRQGSEIRGQGSGTDPGEDPNPEPRTLIPGLRTFLAARLPAYMIPAAFVELDALPLTSNGKLDHDALPAPADGSAPQETFVAPRTPIEAELARIWSETLGVERVGVYDNFFALGGHSLLATRVAAEVQAAFRHELSLQTLFENPTIAGLAEILIQSEVAQAGDAEVEQMLAELEGLSLEEIDALLGASEESNPYE